MIGQEEKTVLVAARTDTCTGLQMLHFDVHHDHRYRIKGKEQVARTRTLICNASFKQNVGHLGTEIAVCVVHGHNRTMKMEWPKVLDHLLTASQRSWYSTTSSSSQGTLTWR